MKSNLIYGKIKIIPKLSKINGALINVRTRATKNKKQSKNKLIANAGRAVLKVRVYREKEDT